MKNIDFRSWNQWKITWKCIDYIKYLQINVGLLLCWQIVLRMSLKQQLLHRRCEEKKKKGEKKDQ